MGETAHRSTGAVNAAAAAQLIFDTLTVFDADARWPA